MFYNNSPKHIGIFQNENSDFPFLKSFFHYNLKCVSAHFSFVLLVHSQNKYIGFSLLLSLWSFYLSYFSFIFLTLSFLFFMSFTELLVISIIPLVPCNLVFISEMIFVFFHQFLSKVQLVPVSYIFLFVHFNSEYWSIWFMVSFHNAIARLFMFGCYISVFLFYGFFLFFFLPLSLSLSV